MKLWPFPVSSHTHTHMSQFVAFKQNLNVINSYISYQRDTFMSMVKVTQSFGCTARGGLPGGRRVSAT